MQYLIGLVAIVVVVVLAITFWYVVIPIILLIVAIVKGPGIVRQIRKKRYFEGEEFAARRTEISSVVAEHNAVAQYANEIKDSGSFLLGSSGTGTNAHLASYENVSSHNYRRDRNEADHASANVHNCSLQIVRKASDEPLVYLMKYFHISATEDQLAAVEQLGEEISRLEEAVLNLKTREASIATTFSPPPFIMQYFADEFMNRVGVELSPIEIPYPEYVFEYVSAGGNSAQRAVVTLNSETNDALVETLSRKITFSKSAAGQRALMTTKLRNHIKSRDNHTCVYCAISIRVEPHLLLEVDHIVPVSRGGLSTLENLQTLCWRCNRSKSNKIVTS